MMGIQPVFAVKLVGSNYLITTDGVLVSHQKLSRRVNRPYDSFVNLVSEGERYNFNLASFIWQAFIDRDVNNEDVPFYFIDGDMGNCALSNLERKTPRYVE